MVMLSCDDSIFIAVLELIDIVEADEEILIELVDLITAVSVAPTSSLLAVPIDILPPDADVRVPLICSAWLPEIILVLFALMVEL